MLTPDEIELKTFAVTLRGFDQTEVTRFLETVAAELRTALERVDALRAGTVLEAARIGAAEITASAEAQAKELLTMAATMRDEASVIKKAGEDDASRVRADATALSERELKQAVKDADEFRLKAVDEIESILRRTDAEVSAMMRAVRESRDDLMRLGQHLVARNQRKGSQRKLD